MNGTNSTDAQCWYEKRPHLLDAEKAAMAEFFPKFKLSEIPDGRLFWRGSVNPHGTDGGVWELGAYYAPDYPYDMFGRIESFGSSVRIYPLRPNLRELSSAIGHSFPCTLRDANDEIYLSLEELPSKSLVDGARYIASAAWSIYRAVGWITLVEDYLIGKFDDLFSAFWKSDIGAEYYPRLSPNDTQYANLFIEWPMVAPISKKEICLPTAEALQRPF